MSASNRIGKVAPYLGRLLSDKRVRRQLAAVAVAARQLARTLREPEPPKRHPIRRILGAVAVAGAAAAIYRQRQSSSTTPQP